MVECKVATWASTIKIFGKYTQICTSIIFSKDEKEANLVVENQEKVVNSIVKLLKANVSACLT